MLTGKYLEQENISQLLTEGPKSMRIEKLEDTLRNGNWEIDNLK